ncbi:uncharacterized protein LOC123692651 [Colias croceus]|uniref:uncharacterized protein LOC123692651 n=1 Tax=Colias crocea TaxID=72248 RepID=UPI001E27C0D4|nr:uncharacterized protein LOC123692651 [Colias croceus]
MVLADFLTETRRKWLQAFKLFKSKNKKARNRVSPDSTASQSCNGTVDGRTDIDVNFCYRTSLPPASLAADDNRSFHSGYNSYSSHQESLRSYGRSVSTHSDSAYDSIQNSPVQTRPVMYTTPTYLNVNDSEDSSSIHTEYTLLDYDLDSEDESTQNMINESIELVTTL